ncbi:hypothetical protein A3C77_02140 [Candidatus Giovannonibacteria bacterium RIFCSPHIGHO2_02_FULL_45_13]|nr:MAG: hypothetical protein A3C77_02140 [Candidatus Giovannonibacteria bacterium RIFCSPHIGHO2_02_FULL_45_13]
MKVLMISGDPGVWDPKSETGKRIEEYRQVLGELAILVCRGNVFSFFAGFLKGLMMLWSHEYDVITAQDIEHSFLAWVFSRLFQTPWQMQIHTDIFSPHFVKHSMFDINMVRVRLARFLLPRASCIRVVSERIKNSIFGTSDVLKDIRCPVIVLPIFVDVEKIKNAPIQTDLRKKYPGRFIILMASRITKEKNIGFAIEAFAEIMKELPPPLTPPPYEGGGGGEGVMPLLLIVGDGSELQNLEFQVSSFKIQDFVIFEPHTSDIASYYKTCDLFLLTSNYEGYGRTLVEAAAAGAKIVSSGVGIASEILEPECVFRAGDMEDLKNKLTAVLHGRLPFPRQILHQTKGEYLGLYLDSFKQCLKK